MKKGFKIFMALQLVLVMIFSMSAPVFACGHSSSKVSYTVYYKDYETKANLVSPVTKYTTSGTTVTEDAKTISGYEVYGSSSKSLKVQKNGCNTITFYYKEEVQTADYVVKYLEYETEKVLATEKKVTDQQVGTYVTETAISIDGYTVVGEDTKTILIQSCSENGSTDSGNNSGCHSKSTSSRHCCGSDTSDENEECNVITFYYEKQAALTSYEVRYLEEGTNAELAAPKVVNEQVVGDEVTETALEIEGYELVSEVTQKLVLDETENVISFYYKPVKKLVSYTIYYMDIDSGIELHERKTVDGLEVGETVTEYAIDIENYEPLELEKTFSVEDGENNIYFMYYYMAVIYNETE